MEDLILKLERTVEELEKRNNMDLKFATFTLKNKNEGFILTSFTKFFIQKTFYLEDLSELLFEEEEYRGLTLISKILNIYKTQLLEFAKEYLTPIQQKVFEDYITQYIFNFFDILNNNTTN